MCALRLHVTLGEMAISGRRRFSEWVYVSHGSVLGVSLCLHCPYKAKFQATTVSRSRFLGVDSREATLHPLPDIIWVRLLNYLHQLLSPVLRLSHIIIRSRHIVRAGDAICKFYQRVANVIEAIFILKWLETSPQVFEFVCYGVLEVSIEPVDKARVALVGGLDVDGCTVSAAVIFEVKFNMWALVIDVGFGHRCGSARCCDPDALILYAACHCSKIALIMDSKRLANV
jgi:hypothetical protein